MPVSFNRRGRRLLALLLGVLVLLLAAPLRAALAPPYPFGLKDSSPAISTPAGSLETARVTILGVPSLVVTAPTLGRSSSTPSASQRAEAIQGNLALLYSPSNLCSAAELITESLLEAILKSAPGDLSCVRASLTQLGNPESLQVRLQPGVGSSPVLEAITPGRSAPLPLLTVTPEDARYHGSSQIELAERWRARLERRLRHARRMYTRDQLLLRWRQTLLVLVLMVLLAAGLLLLWTHNRRISRRLARWEQEQPGRLRHLLLQLNQAGGQLLFLLVLASGVIAAGVLTSALPGGVTTAISLVLQPLVALGKALIVAIALLLVRLVVGFCLHQWVDNVDTPVEQRARRRQRYRNLLQVSHRLTDLLMVVLLSIWVLIDIPGVREASNDLLLAGGALLGGLAIVFQALLRDFVGGLLVLLEDRYAVGDWVQLAGYSGEVVDVGVLSTQLRCLDQSVAIVPNGTEQRLLNETKIRSGAEVRVVLSHAAADLDLALTVLQRTCAEFAEDPAWQPDLLGTPQVRGLTAEGPQGLELSVLMLSKANRQWAASRELRRRLVQGLRVEGIPLARLPEALVVPGVGRADPPAGGLG
ncbi:MAG: mechanosensitive ion channel family protein [Synechococcus sp. Tobar2m-G35]|nr:mechanosensitive ion channel family protein [Synechococcus sp. Tobar2m-G35]